MTVPSLFILAEPQSPLFQQQTQHSIKKLKGFIITYLYTDFAVVHQVTVTRIGKDRIIFPPAL